MKRRSFILAIILAVIVPFLTTAFVAGAMRARQATSARIEKTGATLIELLNEYGGNINAQYEDIKQLHESYVRFHPQRTIMDQEHRRELAKRRVELIDRIVDANHGQEKILADIRVIEEKQK